jgi:hypothetical protein
VTSREAIVESGERSPESPFSLQGVGPIAVADDLGRFRTSFRTHGCSEKIYPPSSVSVFVRVSKAKWRPVKVAIEPVRTESRSDDEMTLNLGAVELPADLAPYQQDA